jgi:hypothetical protein
MNLLKDDMSMVSYLLYENIPDKDYIQIMIFKNSESTLKGVDGGKYRF